MVNDRTSTSTLQWRTLQSVWLYVNCISCCLESVRLEPLPARRVKAGKAVTFTCSLYEGDNVSFFWSKNGVILKTGDRIDISATRYSATLSIRGVKPSDAGDYLCVGRNAVSEEKATAKLQVEGAYLTKARKDFSIICVLFKG